MRRAAGVLVVLLGGCIALLGGALAVLVGTDNRVSTGPHAVETDAVAVVTAPEAISWTGVTVSIDAELPGRKPVFIGVGNAVDVSDYLTDTRAVRIDRYEVPWNLETSTQDGRRWLPATPVALDWWRESGSGMGGASVAFELPDETISVAVLAIGDADLSGLTITASYHVPGGFLIGLGLAGLGLGVALAGVMLFRRGDRHLLVDGDGYVYVIIDEDGNEELVPLDEIDEYEIVDVTGEER